MPRARLVGLFLIALVLYLSNARPIGQVDGRATALMAISLLREGNLDLDEFAVFLAEDAARNLSGVLVVDGRHYAKWSPAAALLYTPLFAVPVLAGIQAEIPDPDAPSGWKDNKATLWIAKIAAALFAAATAVVVLVILRRLCRPAAAMLLSVLFAFGTVAWPINAQDTWQHGPGTLLVALGLLGVLRGRRTGTWRAGVWPALAMAMAVAVRPTNALLVLPLGVLLLARIRRGHWPVAILAAVIPTAALLVYNQVMFGEPLAGGYAGVYSGSPWRTPLHVGLLGLLVSPSRGLLVFSPALLLAAYGAWRGIRHRGRRSLAISLLVGGLAHLAVMSLWEGWYGGWSYGPRFLAEGMPAAVVLLALGVDRFRRARSGRIVLIVLVVLSIAVAALGCYVGMDGWHRRQDRAGRAIGEAVWDWGECQILYHAREVLRLGHPPLPPAEEPPRSTTASAPAAP